MKKIKEIKKNSCSVYKEIKKDVCSICGKEKIIRSSGSGWCRTTKLVCPDGHE